MHDAAAMRVVERKTDLSHYLKSACRAHASRIRRVENFSQRTPFKPFHDNEIKVVVPVKVYESNDIGMREATSFYGLLLKRPQRMTVIGQLRRQYFDGNPRIGIAALGQASIQRLVNDSHTAAGDPFLQHEPVTKNRSHLHRLIGPWRFQRHRLARYDDGRVHWLRTSCPVAASIIEHQRLIIFGIVFRTS